METLVSPLLLAFRIGGSKGGAVREHRLTKPQQRFERMKPKDALACAWHHLSMRQRLCRDPASFFRMCREWALSEHHQAQNLLLASRIDAASHRVRDRLEIHTGASLNDCTE